MKNSHETIFVEKGEKIEIFNRRFSSVPMNYEFSAKAVGSKPFSGWLEVHRQQTVFSSPVKTIDLKQSNSVNASMWDTFMTIYVIAGCDMEISLPKRDFKPLKGVLVLVTLLVLVAAAVLMISLRR